MAVYGSERRVEPRQVGQPTGLLELDLLLAPFVTEAFLELNAVLRQDYRELLFQDDQDLMEWIMGVARLRRIAFYR